MASILTVNGHVNEWNVIVFSILKRYNIKKLKRRNGNMMADFILRHFAGFALQLIPAALLLFLPFDRANLRISTGWLMAGSSPFGNSTWLTPTVLGLIAIIMAALATRYYDKPIRRWLAQHFNKE